MLFNSYVFVLLFAVTFALYYAPGLGRLQVPLLIASSFVFYGYSEPWLLLLLVASILINAICSFQVNQTYAPVPRRAWAAAGVVLNLAILLFFKYSPLTARILRLDYWEEGSVGHFLVHIPLPIGISFFTFQGISLMVDVFRQKPGAAAESVHVGGFWPYLLKTAFFKSFFPQLVAGPIVKAHDFYPQIRHKRLQDVPWEAAFRALVLGYFMKMVVADNLKDLTFWLAPGRYETFSSPALLLILFGYSMQIFADFAGYSLIAIGLARAFGYELMQNFNFPYLSQSLSEFWRRWHISLSTWLKEYLYIPLGGNRRGEGRTYINLITVMLLGGLWHGAAISYAVWGLVHGLGLAVERFATRRRTQRTGEAAPFSFVRMLLVFGFVSLAWLLFKLPNFRDVLGYFAAVGTNWGIETDPVFVGYLMLYSSPVVLWHAWEWWRSRGARAPVFGRTSLSFGYGACLALLLLNSGSAGDFIYFQF